MRVKTALFVVVFSFVCILNSVAEELYPERIVKIDWGQRMVKNQIWDGAVRVSEGSVIAIPFPIYSQNEFGIYNQRVSKTSWKMLTNRKNGGIFLKLCCPDNAVISVYNSTFPFSFTLGDLDGKDNLQFKDGNISVRERTGTYFFVRTGAEGCRFGEGTATIEPETAKINSLGTWIIRFIVGESGIPVGGGIRVAHHHSRGWGEPQYAFPDRENYVTVKCTNNNTTLDFTSPNVEGCFDWPYPKQIILLRVKDTPLMPGNQVTITLGDRSQGSPGYRAAQTNEFDVDFRVETCIEVPDNYFPIYRRIKECPVVTILPDDAVKAFLVAPSVVAPGESFDVKVRMEDFYRNVASGYNGHLDLYVNGEKLRDIRIEKREKGIAMLENISFDRPGVYQIIANDSRNDIEGNSNPIHCTNNPAHRLYWGELHCHTYYSDGYGTKESLFTFLRDVAMLDFGAITDHDCEADSQDYSLRDMWLDTQVTSAAFHEPNRFVTFPAWEWSPHRYAINGDHLYGDHNVFYRLEDPARILLSACSAEFNTIDKVYRGLDTLDDRAIVIPHVGGSVGQWDIHDDNWQPLGEIVSVHGSFEGFGQIALDRYQRKIGFIGGGDNHNGQGGGFPPSGVGGHSMHGGLTAAYARELTRDGLLETFFSRRVYATSGPRILLDVSLDGHVMGSDIRLAAPSALSVLAHGKEPIWKAEVVKNGEVVHKWLNDEIEDENSVTFLWRNWIPKDNYDRNNGRGGGLPRKNWNGELTVTGADIEVVSPCSFHLLKDKILSHDARSVKWTSQTRGDWDGISVTLKDMNEAVSLNFNAEPASFTLKPSAMKNNVEFRKIDDTTELFIIRGKPANKAVSFTYTDENFNEDSYYYVRVTQLDGEEAWASPIYVSRGR